LKLNVQILTKKYSGEFRKQKVAHVVQTLKSKIYFLKMFVFRTSNLMPLLRAVL